MIYTTEVKDMCPVAKGARHKSAPIPKEGKDQQPDHQHGLHQRSTARGDGSGRHQSESSGGEA